MDLRLTSDHELLRQTVREFAETEIRPHVMDWDQAQHFPIEIVPKLAALGLMGIQFPEPYGGAGMSVGTVAAAFGGDTAGAGDWVGSGGGATTPMARSPFGAATRFTRYMGGSTGGAGARAMISRVIGAT